MGKLKGLMTTCLTAAALCMLPLPTLAQTLLEAGKTDVGVLYIDSESVSTVKKTANITLPSLPKKNIQMKLSLRY